MLNWLYNAELLPIGALGVFAAATISSVAGFAFSALCGPGLAYVGIESVRLVQTLMDCSFAIQSWSVHASRHALSLEFPGEQAEQA